MGIVRKHVDTDRTAAATLIVALVAGVASCLMFGLGRGLSVGILATLLFTGVSAVLVGNVTTLWVNRRAHAASRATVHSFFGQAEYLGEIGCATALAAFSLRTQSAFLVAATMLLIATLVAGRAKHRASAGQ